MDRDYISPNLAVVKPDAAFPHMRAGDRLNHPWKYLRRDVPHIWYVDDRYPLMGFLNRDEAILLHNIALQFRGKRTLEIGGWLGWSTAHIALAGVTVDVIDPAHTDREFRSIVEESLEQCGVAQSVTLIPERSPEAIPRLDRKWSLFFIDGDHEGSAPLQDTLACLHYAEDDCAFVFHDLASPDVAGGLSALREHGFNVIVYQTAQIMGMAWRGAVAPVEHIPDPEVPWQIPQHLLPLFSGAIAQRNQSPAHYRRLSDESYPSDETSVPRVCIVTNEIIGPFKNGGIGTSMTGLAETLAASGIPVTVLYTGSVWTPEIRLRHWKKHYAERGIDLVALSIAEMETMAGPVRDSGFGVPFLVYRYLLGRSFDVVHFNDCCGDGSLALAAKKLGVAFENTLLVVAMHSPSQWVLELNQTLPATPLLAAFNYAERLSVKCADVVWSPSRYMLDWARAHEFTLPPRTFIQQYSIPSPSAAAAPVDVPEEIVFFGRLEERKGLRMFCNAVHQIREELAERQIAVTFLGKRATCAGMDSLAYIAQRSADWRFPVKTIGDLGQPEALEYLCAGKRLAVIASPADNSPCTVYETLACGIPFLAARSGGIPELIDGDDALFDCTTDGLRAALLHAIRNGAPTAKAAVAQDETRRSWLAMHAHWKTFLPQREAPKWRGMSAVAIVDHRAGCDLDRTLKSLEAFDKVRLVVVFNRTGETLPPAVRNIDMQFADNASIEFLLEEFAGDAVLLVQSGTSVDAAAAAHMLAVLDRDALDGIVPAAKVEGERSKVIPPLGGSASFSLFHGITFTGGLMIRGTALLRAKSGRPLTMESDFAGLADLCVARGVEIWPWPEPAFEQPKHRAKSHSDDVPSRLHAYNEASPLERYYMLASAVAPNGIRSRKRELAMGLVELGLGPVVRFGAWGLRGARRIGSRLRRKR